MNSGEYAVYSKTLGSLKKTKKIQVLVWGIFMIFLWINVVGNYFTADFSKCSVWDGMLNWSIEAEGEEIIADMLVGAARALVFLFVIGTAGILAFLFCIAEYAVVRTAAKSGYFAVGIQIAALLLASFFPWMSIVLTLGFLESIFKSVYYDKAEKAIRACSEKVA